MDDEECWRAVLARDRAADGRFVFAVASTGVFCRPSCAARRPLRTNTRFFADPDAATRAGFRACLRCRPGARPRESVLVEAACRRIESADAPPPLAALAQEAGLSAAHFQRLFRAATGLSPHAYGAAMRANNARAALENAETRVTDAIYDAGFGSNGRFYAAADATFGMRPAQYRAGGAGAGAIRFALGETTLGHVLVAASARGVCRVALGDDPDALLQDLQNRFPHAELAGGDPEFEALVAQVIGLVEQPAKQVDLPVDLRGTAFQHRVWQALRRIPAGATVTYAALAAEMGAAGAMRAVGRACGANPVAVVIPCHRVVRTDGTASGYAWGLERKAELLARERSSFSEEKEAKRLLSVEGLTLTSNSNG